MTKTPLAEIELFVNQPLSICTKTVYHTEIPCIPISYKGKPEFHRQTFAPPRYLDNF